MIKVDRLGKRYGTHEAVKDLDFSVGEGELFAFIGPNGSGKSTTIRMMTGLLKPTSGAVELFGEEVGMERIHLKKRISFVPDTPDLIGKLTGREYLNFISSAYRMDEAAFREEQQKLVEMFELEGKLDTLVEEYSHGMRQKVALIGALVHKPDILFLDEPTVGLDPKSNRNLKNYLRDYIKQGKTVFLTTHNLALAEEIATDILIIYNGENLAHGSLGELRSRIKEPDATLEDIFLKLTGGS
ncbi:ABC transporter ATP-binding protein [Salinicoccus roseus]|uniref:ABC transporter ATP-binding protein n=1 Tax=Salinicoccus roseus TaxID=45670 RepID=UPI0022FFF370|nr:ABC transporter ATP-binding protein [Salinicoccus roseus]